jgi:hypothetical protein
MIDSFAGTYWQMVQSGGFRGVEKAHVSVALSGQHLKMAIREDVLDLYTRPNSQHPAMSRAFVEELETKLRYMEMPHRMGGMASARGELVVDFLHDDPIAFVRGRLARLSTPKLVFQIASDEAMGWMWGDLRALNVAVSSTALRLNRFKPVHAWIDGY